MEKELPQIAKEINELVKLIGDERRKLDGLGQDCAIAEVNYDKAVAVALIRLKMGKRIEVKFSLPDEPDMIETYQSDTLAGIEKIAKGACWKQQLEMLQAQNKYKSCITNLSALEKQLNAKQSVFRYLDET